MYVVIWLKISSLYVMLSIENSIAMAFMCNKNIYASI